MIQKKNQHNTTCFLPCIHWFIAKCIFSITKPTLPVEAFIYVCTIHCPPCLKKKEIFFSKCPCNKAMYKDYQQIHTCDASLSGDKLTKYSHAGDLLIVTDNVITSIAMMTTRVKKMQILCFNSFFRLISV